MRMRPSTQGRLRILSLRCPSVSLVITKCCRVMFWRRTAAALYSCKWSGLHDRMSDVTNECQEYKAAAVRRQNMTLQHFVITNETDGQRRAG